MRNFKGRTAVVTGAGSGIGRALALAFAQQGTHLALSDIDADGLAQTAKQAESHGIEVFSEVLDVADRKAVFAHKDAVVDHFDGQVHVLINNAGVSLRATTEDMDFDDFEWLMNINFWGVVSGTKAFLPVFRQVDEAHIVNISSIFGIVGVPTQSAYCASKFAVRGFTESLRIELMAENSHIHVSSVHPGGIKTNIVRNGRIRPMSRFDDSRDIVAQFDKHLAQTTAETAANVIIEGMRRNEGRILIGNDAKAIDVAQRSMPTRYQKLALKLPAMGLKPK
ncbi:MAG: SDR family NAD(P)-dependent oxidoreductase [bacterium]